MHLKNKCYNGFNIPEGKIQVIPSGYNHRFFNFNPTDFSKRKIGKFSTYLIIFLLNPLFKFLYDILITNLKYKH